jgi:glyoxylase-like metal-dependent hydrolase (beta-lactamase superfamily II)
MDNTVIVRCIPVGPLQTNCYIVGSAKTHEALIIDPGNQTEKILSALDSLGLTARAIALTHGHYDHIGCLQDLDLPVYIHADDAEMIKDPAKNLSANFGAGLSFEREIRLLKENDIIEIGDLRFKVIHTPGHSPGGICLLIGDLLFSGDTLFCQGIGRTDLPGGCFEKLKNSIAEKLFSSLNDEVKVFPGHGPATSIGREKLENGLI